MHHSNTTITFRLTALWALCESGLGGWMHALHLPFTGFLVGAFAVLIISLISFYSQGNANDILRATFFVILIKAGVSPHTPPPAYIAVAFQGLTGALFFRILNYSVACIFFAVLAMIESALQKLIIATIIFGNSLWEAVDSLIKGIVKEFHLPGNHTYSLWLIIFYTGIYAFWGLFVGIWAINLPKQIKQHAFELKDRLKKQQIDYTHFLEKKNTSFWVKLAFLPVIIALLWFTNGAGKATQALIRSLLVVITFVWFINPVFRWIMQHLFRKHSTERNVQQLVDYLPQLRQFLVPAYRTAATEKNAVTRFKVFVMLLLVITLYPDEEDEQ